MWAGQVTHNLKKNITKSYYQAMEKVFNFQSCNYSKYSKCCFCELSLTLYLTHISSLGSNSSYDTLE